MKLRVKEPLGIDRPQQPKIRTKSAMDHYKKPPTTPSQPAKITGPKISDKIRREMDSTDNARRKSIDAWKTKDSISNVRMKDFMRQATSPRTTAKIKTNKGK